jgi:hypothetical protein
MTRAFILVDPSTLERAKGFEPSTPTLARLCSTPELHPHPACPREVGLRVPQTTVSTPRRVGGSEPCRRRARSASAGHEQSFTMLRRSCLALARLAGLPPQVAGIPAAELFLVRLVGYQNIAPGVAFYRTSTHRGVSVDYEISALARLKRTSSGGLKKAFGDCEQKKRTGLEGKGLKARIVLGRRAQRDRHGTLADGLFD